MNRVSVTLPPSALSIGGALGVVVRLRGAGRDALGETADGDLEFVVGDDGVGEAELGEEEGDAARFAEDAEVSVMSDGCPWMSPLVSLDVFPWMS